MRRRILSRIWVVFSVSVTVISLASLPESVKAWFPIAEAALELGSPWRYVLIGSVWVLWLIMIIGFRRKWWGSPAVSQPPRDPRLDCLEARLGDPLDTARTWLALHPDPDAPIPLADDQVYGWALETYDLICEDFPEHADEFMGGDFVPLGPAFFASAYGEKRETMGRGGYLEDRVALVQYILPRHEAD